jgi:hypothetical protein
LVRKVSFAIILTLVFTLAFPFQLNLHSFAEGDTLVTEEELATTNSIVLEETGYISNETVELDELNQEVENIEEKIKQLSTIEDVAVQEMYEELSQIDIQGIVDEETLLLEAQDQEVSIENDGTITDVENTSDIENAPTEVSISNSLNLFSLNKASANDEVTEPTEIVTTEDDYPQTNEGINNLVDADLTLNIVVPSTDNQGYEVQDIDTFIEKTQEANEETLIEPINAEAASASWGYFFAVQSTFVANHQTTNAKFVQVVEVPTTGGVTRPVSFTIKMANENKTYRDGSYATNASNTFKNVKKNQEVSLVSSISSTKFWRGKATVTGYFSDGSTDVENLTSDRFLLNKKGVIYPTYKDPGSGKTLTVPEYTTWSKNYVTGWTTTDRNKYRNWYNDNYRDLNWSNYEVHHIRPRNYGGTNSNTNLIPLPTDFHRKVVSPWWTNY